VGSGFARRVWLQLGQNPETVSYLVTLEIVFLGRRIPNFARAARRRQSLIRHGAGFARIRRTPFTVFAFRSQNYNYDINPQRE